MKQQLKVLITVINTAINTVPLLLQ